MTDFDKMLHDAAKVRALSGLITPCLQTLHETPQNLATVLDDFRKSVAEGRRHVDWLEEERSSFVAFVRDRAIQDIDRLEREARAAKDAVERDLARALGGAERLMRSSPV